MAETETISTERILIRCPGCNKKLKARRADIGKKARCSRCETKFRIKVDEPEDPGATLLGLPREASNNHRDGERIAIGGEWTSELGWGHDRVVVEVDPNLETFLNNGTCDPLWPDDEEYIEFVNELDDSAGYLRNQWILSYLHHPRASVLNSALSLVGDRYRVAIGRRLTALLSHESTPVRSAAAEALWTKGPLEIAAAFRQLKEQGAGGAELLVETCPEESRDEIEDIHQRNSVEWPEGVEEVAVNQEPPETNP